MSRKRKKGQRPRRPPPKPRPRPPDERPEPEAIAIETSIGRFVYHEGEPPSVQYYLFRPGGQQALAEITEAVRAGKEVSAEDWRRIQRIAVLMLAADRYGFSADLYLDRQQVEEDQVETLIGGTSEFLSLIPSGPEGGSLGVFWMEEIGVYGFPEEA